MPNSQFGSILSIRLAVTMNSIFNIDSEFSSPIVTIFWLLSILNQITLHWHIKKLLCLHFSLKPFSHISLTWHILIFTCNNILKSIQAGPADHLVDIKRFLRANCFFCPMLTLGTVYPIHSIHGYIFRSPHLNDQFDSRLKCLSDGQE